MNKATLDSDLVIILPVLLCFFVLVPSLRILFRCLQRCRELTVLDTPNGVADSGLQKAALIALPITVYTSTSMPRSVSTDCPICLAEFAEGQKMRVLPKCNRGFHVERIDNWLVSHSSCPMCRHRLNLQSGDKKPGDYAIVQSTESSNGMNMVTESTNPTQASGVDSWHIEMFRRTPDEAAVMATSRLPSPPAFSECSEWCIYMFSWRFLSWKKM